MEQAKKREIWFVERPLYMADCLAAFGSLGFSVRMVKARYFLAHPEECRRIGEHGRRTFLEKHAILNRVRRIAEVLARDGILPPRPEENPAHSPCALAPAAV